MILISLTFAFVLVSASDFDPTKHKNWNLLPHDKCGQSLKQRIIGGNEAPMNGYPWIARIGYNMFGLRGVTYRCGGVLVTSKVVLTAAHCVYFPHEGVKVAKVRLGEHDTETDPDCSEDFCADPVKDFSISEIIMPKSFDLKFFRDDIALIRLAEEVKFTSFIKPICISSQQKSYVGRMPEVAGWGIIDVPSGNVSTKLMYVKLKVLENEVCVKFFNEYITAEKTQICAGGEVGKDSCGGDSGGPLMIVDGTPQGPRYILLGVVSFGAKKCGYTKTPGVYTQMSSHMEWFLNNLEKTSDNSVKLL